MIDISNKEKVLETKIEQEKEKIKLLGEEATCPICESEIGKENAKQILTKCEDKIIQYELEIKTINEDYRVLRLREESICSDKKSLTKKKEKYDKQINDNKSNKMLIEVKEESLDKKNVEIKSIEKEIEIARTKLKEAKSNIVNEYTQDELGNIESDKERISKEKTMLNEKIKSYKSSKDDLDELKRKIKIERKKQSHYLILKNIFSKNGIIADIIGNCIEDIEEDCNQILKDINDGEMQVIFRTEKENKDKSVKDTLDIIVETEDGAATYEAFSGGEKTVINFAIRLALSKMLTKVNGVGFGFIVLDEVFGALDEFNRDKMSKVINYLKNEFGQIFIISHDEMKERFGNYIKIVKNARTKISSIEEVE